MDIPFYLGNDAVNELINYCEARNLKNFFLIADRNTYPVLGQKVEQALQGRGWGVKNVVFSQQKIIPNESSIVQVLLQADQVDRVYLAVGSGTLTDITRFISHRMRQPFVSLPTAPSVGSFMSLTTSLVLEDINRQSIVAQPPEAIFADLPTLISAPHTMIAAGYGDILGKAIALADWELGHLLWDEPYNLDIATRVRGLFQACIDATEEIGQASLAGVQQLMLALIDTGQCMLDFGNSHPAVGTEHYMSHFLEMKLLKENRPVVLHGVMVALCSICVAGLFARLRELKRADAVQHLRVIDMPDRDADIRRIRNFYGARADKLMFEQAPFLNMSQQVYSQLKGRILDNWDDVQNLAAAVPEPSVLADLFQQAGGTVIPEKLALGNSEIRQALYNSHLAHNRFTICKLGRMLGLEDGL